MGIKVIYTNELGGSFEFSKETGVQLTAFGDISKNDISLSESTVSNQIGSTISGASVEPKDLTLEGRFKYDPAIRKKLIAVVLPGVTATIRYINTRENIDVYWKGQPKSTPLITMNVTWQKFQFVFRASFPYARSSQMTECTFQGLRSLFKFPRSFSNTEPWKISEKINNPIATVVYNGNINTGFILTMKAEAKVKNPRILNVFTQEHIAFGQVTDLEMQVGDVLEISTYENEQYCHLIRDGEVENIFWMTDYDSEFFKIRQGENILNYTAEENPGSLEVLLRFEEVLAGV